MPPHNKKAGSAPSGPHPLLAKSSSQKTPMTIAPRNAKTKPTVRRCNSRTMETLLFLRDEGECDRDHRAFQAIDSIALRHYFWNQSLTHASSGSLRKLLRARVSASAISCRIDIVS